MSAVIYARLSDRPDKALDRSESIEQQVQRCLTWAATNALEPRGEPWVDKALSGADAARPGLWGAVGALRRGDVLVAATQSRFARGFVLGALLDEVKGKRAKLATVADGILGDDYDSAMKMYLNLLLDATERLRTAERTSRAMKAHQRNGRAMGGNAPRGFKRDGDRLVPDDREQEMIEKAAGLKGFGWSYADIAKELAGLGFKGRGGSPLTPAKISRILKSLPSGSRVDHPGG